MASVFLEHPGQRKIVKLGRDVGRSSTGKDEDRVSQVQSQLGNNSSGMKPKEKDENATLASKGQ